MKVNWGRLLLGLGIVYLLFQALAVGWGSNLGEAGVAVALAVLAALLLVERVLFGIPPADALRALGLGRPTAKGLTASILVSAGVLAVLPVYSLLTSSALALRDGWLAMLPGLFCQAGIAEETLFRGYLFRRIRATRPFWPAALWSALPFLAVHLLLFATMEWPVALAALLLALVSSFPLAHLFEAGGKTVWGPAILHFAIQGGIKVVVFPEAEATQLAVLWMAASAVIPYAAYLVAGRRSSAG